MAVFTSLSETLPVPKPLQTTVLHSHRILSPAEVPKDPHRRLRTAEHVKGVKITRQTGGRGLETALPDHVDAPYGRALRVEYTAFGNDYAIDLHLK
jgi:hypothetical protein